VIEENAFHNSSLSGISIPKSVVSLESKYFSDCRSLDVISFEAGSNLSPVGGDILDGTTKVRVIAIPDNILGVCRRGFRNALKRGVVVIKT
jgi:hypothetical protein